MIHDEKVYRLIFDLKLKRPGCILLAAVYGSDRDATNAFNPDTWLTEITPDLQVYKIKGSELKKVVERLNHHEAFRSQPS